MLLLLREMKNFFKLSKLFLVLALLPDSASAVLIFNIDTFTTDQLTISIPAGSATLDATGTPPPARDGSSDFYLIDPNGLNSDWVVGNGSGTGSGEIDGKAINHFHSLNNVDIDGTSHDVLVFLTDEILSAGNTVTSAISITWSGSNAFDPSAISSLLLTWGYDGISESYPYGDPQGTTSTSAVPDTGSTAALLGVSVVALAFARRRLG